MDTSWIDLRNDDPKYFKGCMEFVELAKETLVEGKTRCPCNKCKLRKWFPINEVGGHIMFNGFNKDYRKWIFHYKDEDKSNAQRPLTNQLGRDDVSGLLKEAFQVDISEPNPTLVEQSSSDEETYQDEELDDLPEGIEFPYEDDDSSFVSTQDEEVKYKKLMEASSEGLYEGCASFSKLSFLLHLFHLKCRFHWSAESFTKLLELLLDAFPQIKEFPVSYYEGKKIINDLGLGYEKIDVCPNNCSLYMDELADKEVCHICHTSRWKVVKGKDGETYKKGEPAKVLRYFPLGPRLKRLYRSSKTAKDMRWHFDREKDGKISHPSDGSTWIDFDKRYPDFAKDPRSVRLGLASDGFNPYRLMNTNYSTWPVILIPYNLPPWLCMKPSSFILSMIIPGKSGPGIDIDVFLQPLIKELKLLWDGVDAFDAYSRSNFRLRVALHSTINDFPAYAMLSGWSTKGYKACPVCTHSTYSYRFGNKICYLGHRKWLPADHPYRSQAALFDGKEEFGVPPVRESGTEILEQQQKIQYVYGKKKKKVVVKKKRKREEGTSNHNDHGEVGEDDSNTLLWSKRSKFFELEYWEHNTLRHSLDVMHIEKNVCDNLLGTLLDMDKSRDDEDARKALEEKNIKPNLWLKPLPNGQNYMPPASYTMSLEEKERFLRVLQKLKVPDGYGSNLYRCVNMKQKKLINMKSHDNHVMMQDILPVALRASNATKVIDLLEELSSFFKMLCSTSIDPTDLDAIQSKAVLSLCGLEKEFLPTFFTIMVHLLIHLVEEVRLGGPVQYRWMYPIERYLAFLKSHVSNRAQPEGSIAEGYLLWETLTFCSRYLEGVETIFNRPKRNDDGVLNLNGYLYNSGGRVMGMEEKVRLGDKSLKQAHRYVLIHSDEMKPILDEFLHQKHQETGGSLGDAMIQNEWIIKEFSDWLQIQMHNINDSTAEGNMRKSLAGGPSAYVKSVKGFVINGHKFDIMDRERHRKTQNSGIMVEADGQEYFGKLKAIYELNYYGSYKVVIFHCDWVDIHRGLKTLPNGRVCVNFSKLMHSGRNLSDDPFVFSSQAKQVTYVEDEVQKGWLHVIKTKPRDLFEVGDEMVYLV